MPLSHYFVHYTLEGRDPWLKKILDTTGNSGLHTLTTADHLQY